jgi:hypothetical protein
MGEVAIGERANCRGAKGGEVEAEVGDIPDLLGFR